MIVVEKMRAYMRLCHGDRHRLLLLQLQVLLSFECVVSPPRRHEQGDAAKERAKAEQRAQAEQGEHQPCCSVNPHLYSLVTSAMALFILIPISANLAFPSALTSSQVAGASSRFSESSPFCFSL